MNRDELFNKLSYKYYYSIISMLDSLGYKDRVTFDYTYGQDGKNGDMYGTTSTASNPYPLIIGIIPPDNKATYIPVKARMNEVIPTMHANTNNKKSRGNVDIVKQEQKYVAYTELVDSIRGAVMGCTNKEPHPEVIKLIIAQILSENGAPLNFNPTKGIKVPNYNMASIHAGKPGKFPDVIRCGQSAREGWENDRIIRQSMGQAIEGNSTQQSVLAPGVTEFNIKGMGINEARHLKKMVDDGRCPDAMDPSNKGFRNPVPAGQCFLSVDTQNGVAYPTYFRAYDSLQEGMTDYLGLLCRKYKKALEAKDIKGFMYGLTHGGKSGEESYMDKNSAGSYESKLKLRLRYIDNKKDALGIGDLPDESPVKIMSYGQLSTKLPGDGNDAWIKSKIGTVDIESVGIEMKQNEWINRQIKIIESTPFLSLLVNPENVTINRSATINPNIKTRYGNIIAVWLQQPIKLSFNGKTAAQIAIAADMNGGLTTVHRTQSLSYLNLMSILRIYRNNGVIYSDAEKPIPVATGRIVIYYDSVAYFGTFDSFTINDSSDSPHNMSYSFDFTCSHIVYPDYKKL